MSPNNSVVMENISVSQHARVCRTCLAKIDNCSTFLRLNSEDASTEKITIRDKLLELVPRLNLCVTPDAVVCSDCSATIDAAYQFRKRCLEIEDSLHSVLQEMDCVPDFILAIVAERSRKRDPILDELSLDLEFALAPECPDELAGAKLYDPVRVEYPSLHEREVALQKKQEPTELELFDSSLVERNEPNLLDLPKRYEDLSNFDDSEARNYKELTSSDGVMQNNPVESGNVQEIPRQDNCACYIKAAQPNRLVERFEDVLKFLKSSLANEREETRSDGVAQNNRVGSYSEQNDIEGNNCACAIKTTQPSNCECDTNTTQPNYLVERNEDSPNFFKSSVATDCEETGSDGVLQNNRVDGNKGQDNVEESNCTCDIKAAHPSNCKCDVRAAQPNNCECGTCATRPNYLVERSEDSPNFTKSLETHVARNDRAESNNEQEIRRQDNSERDSIVTQPSNLPIVGQSSTGEQSYKCNMCDYRALSKSGLKHHLSIHVDDKIFKCTECD